MTIHEVLPVIFPHHRAKNPGALSLVDLFFSLAIIPNKLLIFLMKNSAKQPLRVS
jgi:hypothetical protein